MRMRLGMALSLLLTSCGTSSPDASSLKVTNGKSIAENNFPAVRQIIRHSAFSNYICTGTFVSDNTMLTAAHCIDPRNPANHTLESTGQRALQAWRHPDYDGDVGGTDLGVLIFADRTSKDFTPVRHALPQVGDPFTIVGYGNNEIWTSWSIFTGTRLKGSGAGIKRMGQNHVAGLDHGMIRFDGVNGKTSGVASGTRVLSGSGDSGGPLFIDEAVAGVTSGGWIGESSYVDLTSRASLSFFDYARSKGARFSVPSGSITSLSTEQWVHLDHWEGNTPFFEWTIQLKGDLQQVSCVVYELDPSFAAPRVRVCNRNDDFALTRIGWGGFHVSITAELVTGREVSLTHELILSEQANVVDQ